MTEVQLRKHCVLDSEASEVFRDAAEKREVSGAVCFQVLKVARTIADLSGSERIEAAHVLEALQYRQVV